MVVRDKIVTYFQTIFWFVIGLLAQVVRAHP